MLDRHLFLEHVIENRLGVALERVAVTPAAGEPNLQHVAVAHGRQELCAARLLASARPQDAHVGPTDRKSNATIKPREAAVGHVITSWGDRADGEMGRLGIAAAPLFPVIETAAHNVLGGDL